MLYPFFALAMQSPGRQQTFRRAAIVHFLVLVTAAVAVEHSTSALAVPLLGQLCLIAGIVEGAVLIGWRLTQLPKSQALEFLLASPLRPRRVLLAEALVGLGRLALVTFSGLPVLSLLVVRGLLHPGDLPVLLVMPFTWGAVTGLGLTMWAYEPLTMRRWGERFLMLAILFYLVVGVLAGEHLSSWLRALPPDLAGLAWGGFAAFHNYNPFSVMQFWLEPVNVITASDQSGTALARMLGLECVALLIVALSMLRAASRLKGHFDDRHYRPLLDDEAVVFGRVGDRPLSWWAVRRVMEYSGRVNLWLAGGFGLLYALYTVAEQYWPPWMGRGAFQIFDQMGGIAAMTTALVLLAAVPAAFQYGLWDSNAQDRCRRLELLLLTHLDARDYWNAAAAAAWRRGRGYFAIALLLWIAAAVAQKLLVVQVLGALAAGLVLWGLYFAIGFRAFSRGHQANGLGSLLTIGLPLITFALQKAGLSLLVPLVPPGAVYSAAAGLPLWAWLPGPLLGAVVTLLVARQALTRCDEELRQWYDLHHGRKVMD
jgi:hypothetical protein